MYNVDIKYQIRIILKGYSVPNVYLSLDTPNLVIRVMRYCVNRGNLLDATKFLNKEKCITYFISGRFIINTRNITSVPTTSLLLF